MTNRDRLIAMLGPETGAQFPFVLQMLAGLDPDRLRDGLEALERADAFGALIDPTAWSKSHDARKELHELITAVLPAVRAARAQLSREKARGAA